MAMRNHSLLDREVAGNPAAMNARVHPGWFAPGTDVLEAERTPSPDVLFDVFTQIIKIAGALDRNASDALEELNLTAGAFNALVELGKVGEEGISPSELARRLAVARRTATLYVDILTKHGWAVREAHPVDRRMVLARLSEPGKELLARFTQPSEHHPTVDGMCFANRPTMFGQNIHIEGCGSPRHSKPAREFGRRDTLFSDLAQLHKGIECARRQVEFFQRVRCVPVQCTGDLDNLREHIEQDVG